MTNEENKPNDNSDFRYMPDAKAVVSACVREVCISAIKEFRQAPFTAASRESSARIFSCAHALAELEHGVGNRV